MEDFFEDLQISIIDARVMTSALAHLRRVRHISTVETKKWKKIHLGTTYCILGLGLRYIRNNTDIIAYFRMQMSGN